MYLRIDERTDVLASLTVCLGCLSKVKTEPLVWKWAILTLHNALQGAMVCHLSGTAQIGALSKKSAEAQLGWHEQDRCGKIRHIPIGKDELLGVPKYKFGTKEDQPPEERLADPRTLFRRLYNERKRHELGAGKILDITEKQRKSFDRLNDLRTEFAHFSPKGWSVELTGLPVIFVDVLDVVEMISQDPWPFRHMEVPERQKLTNLISELRAELSQIFV